jgi:hypothetical protein
LIIFSFIWLSYGFVFFGLLLNTERIDVASNFFLNSIVFFIGEFVANLLSGYCAHTMGRLITFKVASIGGGFAFFIFSLLSDSIIKTTFLFLASVGFSAGFNLCYILTPESFTTRVRSTVSGYLNLLSRAGSLMVPGFSILVDKNLPAFLSIIAVSAGLLSFQLEETMNKNLDESKSEIEIPLINKEDNK